MGTTGMIDLQTWLTACGDLFSSFYLSKKSRLFLSILLLCVKDLCKVCLLKDCGHYYYDITYEKQLQLSVDFLKM